MMMMMLMLMSIVCLSVDGAFESTTLTAQLIAAIEECFVMQSGDDGGFSRDAPLIAIHIYTCIYVCRGDDDRRRSTTHQLLVHTSIQCYSVKVHFHQCANHVLPKSEVK